MQSKNTALQTGIAQQQLVARNRLTMSLKAFFVSQYRQAVPMAD